MLRDILILFDNQKICTEALTYAREFALRMDARVTFLMLAAMNFSGSVPIGSKRTALSRMENNAACVLTHCSQPFIQQGIEVASVFRVGDPAQELLKFLADRPPFQSIIWGSDMDLPGKGHWIAKVFTTMECPLLAVRKKCATGNH